MLSCFSTLVNCLSTRLTFENVEKVKDAPQVKELSKDQLRVVLETLNQDYLQQETHSPAQGYLVSIETYPKLKATLTPYGGGKRQNDELLGMPTDVEKYKAEDCVFCAYSNSQSRDPRIVQIFQDKSYAVRSNSGQVLVIPKEHYAHWFKAPIEEQEKLVKYALELRNQNPSFQNVPIQLHCGSAAGQTVFHLHVRTGIYSATSN